MSFTAEEKVMAQVGGVSGPAGNVKAETMWGRSAGRAHKDLFIWIVGGIAFLLAMLILYLLFSGLL